MVGSREASLYVHMSSAFGPERDSSFSDSVKFVIEVAGARSAGADTNLGRGLEMTKSPPAAVFSTSPSNVRTRSQSESDAAVASSRPRAEKRLG